MDYELQKKIEEENSKLPTHLIDTEERRELRNKIKGELLKLGSFNDETKELTGEIRHQKRLDIVIGPPAAGKSTALVNPISAYYKSLIIDSDMAKERLPEFAGGIGANRVHLESKDISLKTTLDAMENGINIVIPIVGKSLKSIEELRKLGVVYEYECHLHLNELSIEKALIRCMERFRNTGRYIAPEYILGVGTKPKENFEILKESGKYKSYSRWSNDVEYGEKPILLESYPDKEGVKEFMFTKEEIDKAKSFSILDYVMQQGLQVKKAGKDFKIENIGGGLYIDIDNNRWKWWGRDKGGGIIQFAMELENKTWVEAVKSLLNSNLSPYQRQELLEQNEEERTLKMPRSIKHINPESKRRVFAYLVNTRGIDSEIVAELMKKGLIYEDEHHNCVFVGKDKEGKTRYGFLRGTHTERRFLGEAYGSDKNYSFSIPGRSNTLYITESAIDLLSYQTLLKRHGCLQELRNHHFLSLGGVETKALNTYLNEHSIEKIICCLDNDEAGKEAVQKIAAEFGDNYTIKAHFPKAKDFNVQLKQEKEEELEQEMEQMKEQENNRQLYENER